MPIICNNILYRHRNCYAYNMWQISSYTCLTCSNITINMLSHPLLEILFTSEDFCLVESHLDGALSIFHCGCSFSWLTLCTSKEVLVSDAFCAKLFNVMGLPFLSSASVSCVSHLAKSTCSFADFNVESFSFCSCSCVVSFVLNWIPSWFDIVLSLLIFLSSCSCSLICFVLVCT